MRNLTSITAAIVASRKPDPALERAHRHAAEFHEAMAEALEAQMELDADAGSKFWQARYGEALGQASRALALMPVKWAAVLGCELTRVAVPAAAE
jgi:hypothetical protein